MTVHPHTPQPKPATQTVAPASEMPTLKSELAITVIDEAGKHEDSISAIRIHNQAMAAIANFHDLYVQSQKSKTEPHSHGEQDLLRAMLLFACSGLDAVVKQLITDALGTVLDHDLGAQQQFKVFVERRLRKSSGIEDRDRSPAIPVIQDVGLLADLLVSVDPRSKLIDVLTESLKAESLQSRDQLLRVAAHFALTRDQVMADDRTTRDAFEARNQITHEMDVDLPSGKERRERDYATMVHWCENFDRSGDFLFRDSTTPQRMFVPPMSTARMESCASKIQEGARCSAPIKPASSGW